MTTLSKLLVLVLALVTVACSEDKYTTEFDASSLTEAQMVAAQDAADQWCEATQGVCCPTFNSASENKLSFAHLTDRKGNTNFHAGVTTITVRDIYAEELDLVGRIIRHEFGHACRAAHVGELDQHNMTEEGHVMSANDNVQSDYITSADVVYAGGTVNTTLAY